MLLPTFDVGGAERVALRLASALDPRRYEISIVAFVPGDGRLREQARAKGLHTAILGRRGAAGPLLVFRLYRWLRRARPDVLATFMFHANVSGRLAGRLAGVPVILNSERVVGWESRYRVLINRWTVTLADVLTTNSAAGREFWSGRLGVPRDRMHVLYNGLDTDEFAPGEARPVGAPCVIGVLARLHRANGHDWFLSALARLPGEPNWTCLMSGDGPEGARLSKRVSELGLADRVKLVGHVKDAPQFLRSLDVYVHPALVAGMPNAVLEAMACGVPVVATAVGGTPEAVVDGDTGWLVAPGDIEATTDRIARLLRDPAMRRRMGDAGRERAVAVFSVKSAATRLETLMRSALDRQRRRGVSPDRA
jgi:glycosyltransferase involved in cell wall biosynthesis